MINHSIYDLDTVVITLDPTCETRAVRTFERMMSLGFKNIQFLQGIRGKDLFDEDVKRLLSLRAYFEFKNGRCVHEGISGLGSIGCYLSHMSAWKRCVEAGRPLVVVEDDLITTKNAQTLLPKVYRDAVLHNYGLLRLGYSDVVYNNDSKQVSEYLTTHDHSRTGTMFYIITPAAAAIALNSALPIEMHVDWYLSRLSYRNSAEQGDTSPNTEFRQYCSIPNMYDILGSINVASDIGHNGLKCQKTLSWFAYGKNIVCERVDCRVFASVIILMVLLILILLPIPIPVNNTFKLNGV